MSERELQEIRELGESSDAAHAVASLLARLAATIRSIPEPAGELPGAGLHSSIETAEAIRNALVEVLLAKVDDEDALRGCVALSDVAYRVYHYYPPAALAETVEYQIDFGKVRELAAAQLAR